MDRPLVYPEKMENSPFSVGNVRRFVAFRVLFNSRFYYPVFTILFLDFGLTLSQFALLNVAWAVSIVVLEVPSGALADIMGRRNLLVLAASLMVVEMAILCVVPLGRVLDWQIRFQSLGFMLAMTLGAAVYDPALVGAVAGWLGYQGDVTQEQTLRLPLYLTLGTALLTLYTTLRMEQEPRGEDDGDGAARGPWATAGRAFRLTLEAGTWIVRTPLALSVILFGVLLDHVIRMVITLTSQYYRVIELPEASFGLIGSALAAMGLVAPRAALHMARRLSPAANAAILGGLTLAGLWGLGLAVPWWGLAPMALLMAAMHGQHFFVSHYLNAVTASRRRATVLSFKGLSYNLAYGAVGLLYSLLLALLRGRIGPQDVADAARDVQDAVFVDSLAWFPPYFLLLFVAAWLYARHRLRGRSEHLRPGGPAHGEDA
jgi:hypothetical protein